MYVSITVLSLDEKRSIFMYCYDGSNRCSQWRLFQKIEENCKSDFDKPHPALLLLPTMWLIGNSFAMRRYKAMFKNPNFRYFEDCSIFLLDRLVYWPVITKLITYWQQIQSFIRSFELDTLTDSRVHSLFMSTQKPPKNHLLNNSSFIGRSLINGVSKRMVLNSLFSILKTKQKGLSTPKVSRQRISEKLNFY